MGPMNVGYYIQIEAFHRTKLTQICYNAIGCLAFYLCNVLIVCEDFIGVQIRGLLEFYKLSGKQNLVSINTFENLQK